jgi:predicted ArsR family transcriptional regulator
MLKRILAEIDNGCGSVPELSEKLGIDEAALSLQLRILVQQGYLSAQECQPCKGCPLAPSCPSSSGIHNPGAAFSLTEKAMNLLEK